MNKGTLRTEREIEYDLLRIISLLGVIVIHVCAMQWRKLETASCQWTVLHVYDMLSKFSVPVFFMISGRFMLDPSRPYTMEKILRKIVHIVVVFLFWSAVYTILNLGRMWYGGGRLMDNKWVIVKFFTGEYHMWFLFVIVGLYILTPLLRYIAASQEATRYYLILFLTFGSLLSAFENMPVGGAIVREIRNKLLLDMAVGYSGYYLMGHWLRRVKLCQWGERCLYLGGVLGSAFTVIATWYTSWISGSADETLASYLMPNVVLTSAAVYYFIISHRDRLNLGKWVFGLAEFSFGCYLVHPLVLWIFEWTGLMPTLLAPVIMVPILTGLTLLLSLTIVVVMKKIPLLRSVVS